jgi:EAL and modified HD-GYP domain-containing signal transduction protein
MEPESGFELNLPAAPGRLCTVARQPILDLRSRVHAYKLHLRAAPALEETGETAWQATTAAAAFFGLQRPSELKKLTGKMPAFVSCPLEALTEELAQILPASLTVLELPSIPEAAPEFIALCQQLKEFGFKFSLDATGWTPQKMPLLDLADYVRVDFSQTTPEQRQETLWLLRGKTIVLVAKSIDTQATYRRAREEGFSLFEGYFFCEPVPVRNRRPPVNQMLRLDILRALQIDPLDLRKLADLVKRDGPLTYQLLRLVNSPLWAMRQTVESVEVAMLALGDDAIRRVATMAIASEFNGTQPAELLCMAMVRARFCEVGTIKLKRNLDHFGQYLLGLLSLMPAMQGQPMSDIAPSLPLADEIRDALLGTANTERALLGWLEHLERGDQPGCDAAAEADHLDQAALAKVYVDVVAWAEAALHSVG